MVDMPSTEKIVSILGMIYGGWGALNIVLGIYSLVGGAPLPGVQPEFQLLDTIIILFISGMSLMAGIGLILRRWWGRYVAMALAGVAAIVSSMFFPPGIVLAFINLGILYFLSTEEVKNLFN